MNHSDLNDKLKIRLTAPLPEWAKSGVVALSCMPGVEILASADPLTPDVILHYGDHVGMACQQYGYGKLGFWYFRWAGSDSDAVAAARCSAAVSLALEVGLWARYPDGRCECLYQSFGFLEPFAIKRSVRNTLVKAAFFPARVVAVYFRRSALPLCNAETVAIEPSFFVACYAEVKAILQKIVRKLFYKEQWFVVAGIGNDQCPVAPGKWHLDPGPDRFWADPFILEYEERRWVFVEELPYSTWRGYLSVIELFSDGSHSESRPVIVTDKHLSYPFMFTWKGDLYMVPESGSARNLVLWKCESFPERWQQVAVLLTNVYAADATLIEFQGYWWMFIAVAHEGACIHDELHVYFADSPLGPWQAHSDNPVKSDARNARPAGNMFVEDGVLYRPAQDCSTEYGKATVLNRVDRLDTESFSETPVARLDSHWHKDFLRTHTLSRSQNLWAIDGYRLIPRWRSTK